MVLGFDRGLSTSTWLRAAAWACLDTWELGRLGGGALTWLNIFTENGKERWSISEGTCPILEAVQKQIFSNG